MKLTSMIATGWLALASLATNAQSTPDLAAIVANAKPVPPFKMFDNLYYIGIDWVSAYLIPTEDGLILIDALYGEFTTHAIDSIRKLGFDPKQIKYVLVTHAHFDHLGGAAAIKAFSGARIGMTAADWDLLEADRKAGRLRHESVPRDLVLKDGDILALGDQRLKFYVTPGHTRGVLSIQFNVRDDKREYRAFTFGGAGLNFNGAKRVEQYIASIQRVKDLGPMDVNAANHPTMARLFERSDRMKQVADGSANPFVDPVGFSKWLQELQAQAQKKLEQERAAEKKRSGG